MMSVSRLLMIDSFEHQSLKYFASVGFERSLLSSWDHEAFKTEVERFKGQYQPREAVGFLMTDFLKQRSFNRYDLVLMVDWYNSTESSLPVYIRVRRSKSKGRKKSLTRIYSLNLFSVFDNQEAFLDHCYSQLNKIHSINRDLKYYSRNFEMLRQNWQEAFQVQQENHAIEQHILALQKRIDDYFNGSKGFNFTDLQKLQWLNRIAYFICGHYLRSWYFFGSGDPNEKAS